jgi:putative transposase
MNAVQTLSERVGVKAACAALRMNRSRYYRAQRPRITRPRPAPPLKLSPDEYHKAHALLLCERFVDQAPASIVATLLDEGEYVCSERTLYRILAQHHQLKERRRGHRQGAYSKPELLATAPNQVWSWDITKLKGPVRWSYFYLYVILDIFSRYVVGWMIADREAASLAKTLIRDSCEKQHIQPQQLTLHADRGASMKSKVVAHLLADLGVTKTHSRPRISDDNPYSEAQFKTFKYRPDFPERFGSIQDARVHCQHFFRWYNQQHKHCGIAMLTPQIVHYGNAENVLNQRQQTLNQAFDLHPSRFKGKQPCAQSLPKAAWINKPNNQCEVTIL